MIELQRALEDARVLVKGADENLEPAMASLQKTLEDAQDVFAALESQLEDDSAVAYQVGNGALKEIEGAARSLRVFCSITSSDIPKP